MTRSIRRVKPDPPARREPPARARYRAGHVTVGVLMTVEERDALAVRATAAGVSMGALLRGDQAGREAELATVQKRARAQRLATGRGERAAEVEALRRDLAAATPAGEARTRAAVAGWRAAFAVMRDAAQELAGVIAERVPMATVRPGRTGESYMEAFNRRLQARLAEIPAPPGGWPEG